MEIHQFLHRGAPPASDHEHFVSEMQALIVRRKDMRADAHPIADQQLALVEITRLDHECSFVARMEMIAALSRPAFRASALTPAAGPVRQFKTD